MIDAANDFWVHCYIAEDPFDLSRPGYTIAFIVALVRDCHDGGSGPV